MDPTDAFLKYISTTIVPVKLSENPMYWDMQLGRAKSLDARAGIQYRTYLTLTGHTYLTKKHIPVHKGILIDLQVIHNKHIHALAEPISGQTQDNMPSLLSLNQVPFLHSE
ncbi:hypothetical protein TNCV_1805391 [Trichonephila clavipes]|nr:hypothetical protein TNCV_1805391 [Trichonephila clavipes]